MWFYKIMCVIMLATGTVQGSTFTTNTAITNWENAPCKLAVPSPKYSIDKHWTVDEPHLPIPKNGLWIGYVYGQVAFDYLGCSSDCTENTTDVKSVGECHLMCRGKAFGIQKAESIDSVRCCCRHYTGSLLSKSCNDQCGDDGMFLCGKKDSENNSFSIYGITNVSAFNNNTESFVCLDFNYPNFIWTSCKGPSKGLMCSKFKDGKRLAVVQEQVHYADTWVKANQKCFVNTRYPATVDSIRSSTTNRVVGPSDSQPHWTGVIRTHAMLNAENKDFITSSSIKYAVINQDRSISYEVHGCRSSLCDDSDSTSMSTTSTTSGIATNSCNHGGATVNGSSTNAVGVYIGVAVGLLCAVGAVVVIIVLWRRGVIPCRLRSKHDKTNSETRDCACKSNATYENEVQNHNYFILEKCAHLVDKSEDHKDTAYESNKGNAQTDTYNSIDEAEEPYQSIKDEYDYTNNALPNKRKPDNVYNKLKQDLPGNYAHVRRPGQTITKAGSDYDTTAVAPGNDGDGDYNHIPHPDRTTCARRNGSNDDYDVINGKKIQFPPIDSADYAHVKV